MNWNPASNPFESLTRRRYAAMDALLADHTVRCADRLVHSPGDPDLKILQQRAIPARAAWNVVYIQWSVSRRTHKGRTFALNELVRELRSRHISLWQVMIQRTALDKGTWMKGGTGFEALFPAGRRPFQQGGMEARVAAVSRLATSLSGHPALAEVHLAVRAFHLTLTTARTLQQEARVSMTRSSAALEKQRKDAASVLYRNLARLMEKYADTPASLWSFFDRKLLARSPATKVPA